MYSYTYVVAQLRPMRLANLTFEGHPTQRRLADTLALTWT